VWQLRHDNKKKYRPCVAKEAKTALLAFSPLRNELWRRSKFHYGTARPLGPDNAMPSVTGQPVLEARMGDVVSLGERRERQLAEQHARALVMFECAANLARQAHPGLVELIREQFGDNWVEERVQATVSPRRVSDAPRYVPARRRPATP
jgi:hypothetical protein